METLSNSDESSNELDKNAIRSRIEAINESLMALERQKQNSAPTLSRSIEAQRDQLETELRGLEDELT